MKNVILGLFAETSIHAGAGSSLDVIDLPIQREAHTGFPCIFGSGMKGAMRAKAEVTLAKEDVILIFGPEAKGQKDNPANESAGSVNISDAKLLLLPVPSLTGYFKWVTCPALLNRLSRDLKRLGFKGLDADLDQNAQTALKQLNEQTALVDATISDKTLFLNEYNFETSRAPFLEKLCPHLEKIIGSDYLPQHQLRKQIVILSNDQFAHFARYAPPVHPHIALESETKMTKKGALWFEEILPAETVLYTCVNANPARNQKEKYNAAAVMNKFTTLFPQGKNYLQVGGNETVGMGWVHVNIYEE